MSLKDRVREKATDYPELVVTERPGWIDLRPPGEASFSVRLAEHDGCYTVYFEGWHEEVEDEAEALSLLGLGLSADSRLKVASRGNADYCWILEVREGDGWRVVSETGLLLFPFWRRKRVRYLQNAVVSRRRGV